MQQTGKNRFIYIFMECLTIREMASQIVSVRSGYSNKISQASGLNERCLFLTILEAGSVLPGSRCQQIGFLMRAFFLACRLWGSVCILARLREAVLVFCPLLIKAPTSSGSSTLQSSRPSAPDLVTSQRSHFLTPSYGEKMRCSIKNSYSYRKRLNQILMLKSTPS